MKSARVLSLLLAGVLQFAPVLRVALPAQISGPSTWAIIFKFGAGLAAALGSYNAVSGATNLIPNGATYNLTVGRTTNLLIGYSGAHTPASFSANPNPVCPGMTLNNASGTSTSISGTPSAAGTYSSTATAWENGDFSGRSVSATYTFIVAVGPPPPVITNIVITPSPPVAPGVNVTLTPTVGGTGPFTYRWYFNGAPVFGATNASLVITNVQGARGGGYSVVVKNTTFGFATNATNLVISSAPVFTTQPQTLNVANNSSATFSVLLGGLTPFSYQWRKNGTNLPNATNASLTVSPATVGSAGVYSVEVTNTLGSVVSSNAFLRISPSAGSITVPLFSMSAPWRYGATGNNLGSAWREFDFNDATWPQGNGILAVEAAANAAVFPYIGTTLALNSGGHFVTNFYFRNHFTITNRALLSSIILSNVIDDGAVTYFNNTEVNRFNMPGGEATATTWALVGSTEGVFSTTTLPVASVVQGDNVVAVEVHQVNATSSDIVMGTALFAVYSTPNTVPFILTNPLSAVASIGSGAGFTAAADGSALTYRWYHDGVLLPAATSPTLNLPAVDVVDSGNYVFVAANAFGSATSQVATLTIPGGTPPVITTQPADGIVPAGGDTSFAVVASGTGKVYQWLFNSNLIVSATAPVLSLTNLSPGQSGYYSVTVSNGADGVRSREAQLLVVPPPQLSNSPRLDVVAGGSKLTLAFPTEPGFRYVVQSSPTVDGTNWLTITNVLPSFNAATINVQQDFSAGPQSFLRVLVIR